MNYSSLRYATTVLLASSVIAGCGKSDPQPAANRPADTPPPTTQADAPAQRDKLESAVREYSAAFLRGDDQGAWDLLSGRCRDRTRRTEFADLVSTGAALYGDAKLERFHIDTLDKRLGRVTYTYDMSEINQQSEPWALEDGSWHNDDC